MFDSKKKITRIFPITSFNPPSAAHFTKIALWAIVACVFLLLSPAPGTAAQTNAEQAQLDANRQLLEIQAAITLSEQHRQELRQEVEAMDGDRTRQNAALIAAAQRVKLTEIEVADIEQRLSQLLIEEDQIRARLDSADINVSNLLAAIQTIGKNPPPALIIDPSDAINSARAASLLSSILPQLRQKADLIIADLTQLSAVKQSVIDEQTQLSSRFTTLFEEQLRIATLIEARKRGVVRLGQNIAAEELEAEALAKEATSLQELIASLQERIAAVAKAGEAADAASLAQDQQQGRELSPLTDEEVAVALADTLRTQPAFPFTSAIGHLQIPATGVI
ncbi:MAG TPA: hypothetical protein ENK61_04700, partial [Devosia sp.]|nr:hypothetical protein [Devosia sp.]